MKNQTLIAAKNLLESKGYTVKKLNESYNPNTLEELVREYAPKLQYGGETLASIWDDIVQEYDDEDLANDVIEALENEDVYESKKINEFLSTVRSRAMLKELGFDISMLSKENRKEPYIQCFCDIKQKNKHEYYTIECVARNCSSEKEEKELIAEFTKNVHDVDLKIGKPAPKVAYGARAVLDIDALAPIFDSISVNEAGWMVNHPGYDPIGAPAISDEDIEKSKRAGEDREKAFISKRRKEEGAPKDYEYDGRLNKFIKSNDNKTDFEIWNESASFDEKDILHKLDQFQSQITVSKSDEKALRDILDKKHVSYQIDDRTPGKLRFRLKYNESKDMNESEKLGRGRYCIMHGDECIDSYTDKKDADDWVAQLYKDGDFKRGELNVVDSRTTDIKDSKDVEEHLEVSAGAGSTTAEKVAYVKKMVEKAKNDGDEHSAWDIVDFLYDSMLLDKIPLSESKKMRESSDSPHTEQYKGYSIQSYDDFGATVYKNGKKIKEFENIDDAREYIDGLDEDIVISKSDDLVGKPSPKFTVTYSTGRGSTSTQTVEANDERSAKAIITGRCKRTGKVPKFISIEKVSESIDDEDQDFRDDLNEDQDFSESLDYEDMRYWNPVAIGSKIADYLGTDATKDEIESEVSKIIDKDDSKFQRAVTHALKNIDMDKKHMNEDPMHGYKYRVSGSTPNVTETGTDFNVYGSDGLNDPKESIKTWFELSDKAPMDIAIMTNKNANAEELLAWVVNNEAEFREMYAAHKCPYRLDYLINACKRGNTHDYDRDKYHYPDQIHPFSVG